MILIEVLPQSFHVMLVHNLRIVSVGSDLFDLVSFFNCLYQFLLEFLFYFFMHVDIVSRNTNLTTIRKSTKCNAQSRIFYVSTLINNYWTLSS